MPRNARAQGYSRRHRFASPGAFGPVLRGSRKIRGRLATLHVVSSREGSSRLGVAVTRRLVPLSVDRNCLKRIAREAFRRHDAKRMGLDCVLMLRERIAREQQAAFAAEVGELLDRLQAGR
jgi:ribonuclease P protein component